MPQTGRWMPKTFGSRHRFWPLLLLILAGCSGGATGTPVNTPSPISSPQAIAMTPPPAPGTPPRGVATPGTAPTRVAPTAGPASPTAAANPSGNAELGDAGMLIYVGRLEGKEGIVAVNADGSGRWLMAEGRYEYLLWAPDGSRFAAVAAPGPGSASRQVAIFSAGGRELGRRGFDGPIDRHLQWAPDSRRLLGATRPSGGGPFPPPGADAWIMQDGALQPVALPEDNVIAYFSWLPDGRILLASYRKSAIPAPGVDPGRLSDLPDDLPITLWAANAEGREAREAYEGPLMPFGVSGDGASVFGHATRFTAADEVHITEIFSIDLATGRAQPIRQATDLAARVFGSAPAPAGATFLLSPGSGYGASLVAPATDRLALALVTDRGPQPSPTGTRMADESLVVLDSSGGFVFSARVPRTAGIAGFSWSLDGTKLAYLLGSELHIVEPAAGIDRALPVGADLRDFSFAWSPDGRWLAYGGTRGVLIVSVEAPGRTFQLDREGLAPAWQPGLQRKRLGGPQAPAAAMRPVLGWVASPAGATPPAKRSATTPRGRAGNPAAAR